MELRVNTANMETNEDGSMTVSGYVNRTDQPSHMLGRERKFREVIKKGAWQRAIDKAKEIHFYAEHDKNKILSSTRNGSLELREDENGLYMTAKISPTSWGKDYYQLIKDGILQNMSFGFRSVKDEWHNMGDYFERTVNDLELFEVSVVRDPAYASSSISARGIDLVEDEVPDSEINLRTIEIRSEEDIEAIAKKIFEMLQANVKIAEGKKEEAVDEAVSNQSKQKLDEAQVEEQVATEQPTDEPKGDEEVEEKPVDEETEPDEKTEDEVTDEKQEETKDEVDEESPAAIAANLRDFINKHKMEDKQNG